MERLKDLASIDLRMVAYKGDSYALTDLVAGHVQAMFAYVTIVHTGLKPY
jgi:tripartite-type tricarboxylate transporter receptor subunit TctC